MNKNLFIKALILAPLLFSIKLSAVIPVANFSYSPNPVCSGNLIQVSDLSTNVPTAWSYTIRGGFGPGGGQPTVVTVQNPTLIFNAPGIYTISLVASNASGSSSVFTQTLQVLQSPNANINPVNQTNCPGGNPVTIVVLTGGGPGGGGNNTYSWSNGATSSSITVSPSVTTSYSCTVTNTNGCSIVRVATVTISQTTITINGVPANICPGSTTTLTANSTGLAPFNYTWSNGSNNSSITTSLAGVYSVTITTGNGCNNSHTYSLTSSNTLSLTATANPSAVCSGSLATINVSGATNYTWSNGSNASSFTVNPSSTTTYTVVGQLGICVGATSITLNVSNLPTLTINSSASSICAGGSASLNASGATNYTWTPGNIQSANIVVSPLVPTTYTVRGINPGCPARSTSITINVSPSPVISVSSNTNFACAGDVVALVASGANTYSWSSGQNAAIILVTPTLTTTYTVTGTNQNNCSASAAITQSVSDCTSMEQINNEKFSFRLFPNPSSGTVTIQMQNKAQVSLLNQLGQLIYSGELNENNQYSVKLNQLAKGLYFVRAQSGKEIVSRKLVVSE